MEINLNTIWQPNVMVLGSGGAKGFLILGVLKKLVENNFLKLSNDNSKISNANFLEKVDTWVGVSVGAAISLLSVVGYTVDEIINLCIDLDLIQDILSINLDEARQKMGLIQNKTIEEKLKQNIARKYGYVPTLAQLYMLTGLNLSLVTFNMDKMRTEFLDKDTEPELSCVEAAMMSMAIPILMQPRKYKSNVYIDGAVGSPYPVLTFDHDDNKVLGLYISSEEDLYSSENNFIYRLMQASIKMIRDKEIKYASANVKHISLKTLIRDTTGISISKESRQSMVDQGYKCAEEFLEINSNPEKYQLIISENEEIPFNI